MRKKVAEFCSFKFKPLSLHPSVKSNTWHFCMSLVRLKDVSQYWGLFLCFYESIQGWVNKKPYMNC